MDFYCQLVHAGHWNGDIHGLQQEEDARREKVLIEVGLRIVRYRNDEVVKDLSAVVGRISELCESK